MNNQGTNGRKPGNTMRIGAIIAIIGGGIGIVGALIMVISIFSMAGVANAKINDFTDNIHHGRTLNLLATIVLILSLMNIPSIIFNSLLLKGKLKSNITPGVLAIISLGLSVIGLVAGILILASKFEDQVNPEQNKDFVSRNFNTDLQQKPETAGSWKNSNQPSTTIAEDK